MPTPHARKRGSAAGRRAAAAPGPARSGAVDPAPLIPGRSPVRWREQLAARAVLVVEWRGLKVLAPRVIALLGAIAESGSIRRSAGELGIGYRHALQWIVLAELALDRPVVERHAGGATGGGASLTPAGRQLVRAYAEVDASLRRVVERAATTILGPPAGA